MPDMIACPECRRRLKLPPDCVVELVQCPSCGEEFTSDSVPRLLPGGTTLAAATNPMRPPQPPPIRRSRADAVAHPPKKDSWSPWLIAFGVLGVLAVAVVAGTLGCAYFLTHIRPSPPMVISPPPTAPVPRIDEDLWVPPMANPKPVLANELAPQLQPLFVELGAGLRSGASSRIMPEFDTERAAVEFTTLTGVALHNPQEKHDLARAMAHDLEAMLVPGDKLAWNAFEIREVKKLNDREVIALVHHANVDGRTMKRRWWLTRRTGTWKVYDMENLAIGLRYSLWAGSTAGQNIPDLANISRELQRLGDAISSLFLPKEGNKLEELVRELSAFNLPRQLEPLRYLVIGRLEMQRGQFPKAVAALEKAHGFQPDMPALDYQQGVAFNKVNQRAQALEVLEAFHHRVGDDPEVCHELGEALRHLGRFPEAARAYRAALDLNPKRGLSLQGLLYCLGQDPNKDDVVTRFVQLDERRGWFDALAQEWANNPEILDLIVRGMQKEDPGYVPVFYYDALVKAHAGQADLAVPLFKTAWRRQTDAGKRQFYVQGFLSVMMVSGKLADAYAAVPDAREAFRYLAEQALLRYQIDSLRQLVALHGKANADDPLLPWYQGVVYLRDGRYALADRTFTAALSKKPAENILAKFRRYCVEARYHAGQTLAAYRDIGPRDETFRQLAGLCFFEHEDDQLQALLDAHAQQEPESLDLLTYGVRLKIRRNQIADAIALFKKALAKPQEAASRDLWVNEILRQFADSGRPLEGYRAAPDASVAFNVLARTLLGEKKLQDLRNLLEAHRAAHADDPWLAYYQAELHFEDYAYDKAAQVLKEALKQAPKENHDRFWWRYMFAMYKSHHSVEAYLEADDREAAFNYLAEQLLRGGKNPLLWDLNRAEMKRLLAAHRQLAGDSAEFLYFEARAKVLNRQPDQANVLFEKACRLQANERLRQRYVNVYVEEMEAQELGLEAYRGVSDKTAAFDTLARRWVAQKKIKELATLLDEHAQLHGDDDRHRHYRGELLLLRGELAQADQQFTACLAKCSPAYRSLCRDGLMRVRVKLGKAVATYEELGPGAATFESLAQGCLQEKDARQLQALIDAHFLAHPEDPTAPAWHLEVKWLNEDFEGVLKLLTDHQDDVFCTPKFAWKAARFRVRALLKLKRIPEAIQEAEALKKNWFGRDLLVVLAHAAGGNVQQTIAVVEKMQPKTYLLVSFYQDADLGMILRSEPFAAFREKFPQPKMEPGREDPDFFDDDDD